MEKIRYFRFEEMFDLVHHFAEHTDYYVRKIVTPALKTQGKHMVQLAHKDSAFDAWWDDESSQIKPSGFSNDLERRQYYRWLKTR